jgi:uncharacterized protein (TIGR02996 family)
MTTAKADAQLLQAILRDPSDLQSRLVYAA